MAETVDANKDESKGLWSNVQARGILGYLLERPRSQDTLEGIAHWWLLKRYVQQELAAVDRALRELVELDFVQARTTADSRVHYRINEEKLEEIKAFLETGGTS